MHAVYLKIAKPLPQGHLASDSQRQVLNPQNNSRVYISLEYSIYSKLLVCMCIYILPLYYTSFQDLDIACLSWGPDL